MVLYKSSIIASEFTMIVQRYYRSDSKICEEKHG